MADDKVVSGSFCVNGEKVHQTGACNVNLNLTDEVTASTEYIACPEFQFATSACCFCNGYYGPCFGEPICPTCHAFLFPNDIGLLQVSVFSEKTDDEDSGNDEPTEFYYSHERRTSQQNYSQNANSNVSNISNISNSNSHVSPRIYLQNENISAIQNYQKIHHGINTSNSKGIVVLSQNMHRLHNTQSGKIQDKTNGNDSAYHQNHNEKVSTVNSPSMIAGELHSTASQAQEPENYQQCQCNYKVHDDIGESSRSYNLSERLEMLTNDKHIEHEPINEPELVERLPPEVLLVVFSYLDDVSLWSAANVCRRWCGLLSTHITPQQWQQNVKLRWPLYKPIGCVTNWYKVYDFLASSAPCRTCLAQTCLRSRHPRMEENPWRIKRLNNEIKRLRTNPPECILATPLDEICCHWQATITGPVESPYEGGLFYLYLEIPGSYPLSPPIVRFLTKILHPNVSRHGDVGIDTFHHNWSLALTLSKVLISVQSLLTDPYCQVCMEPEVGEMYLNDRERFDEIARAWTWKYAMHDVMTPL
ncbi:modifier of rpr and grim, ubiquitously expressed isoform X1 [Andrena cerasifolii]|uniref:modifier of rpr and grim, ubiquitously expressed isoform X1 n=1 Tax=Andrena cerasifolii TaxID=2819439 RepID=UPI004038224B